MPELTDAQRTWLHDVLGLDPDEGGQRKQSKGGIGGLLAKATGAKDATPPAATPPGAVGDKAVDAALDALKTELDALQTLGFDTTRMLSDHADMQKQGTAAAALPDEAARKKALAAVLKRTKEMVKNAKGLAASTKSVMGKDTGAPNETQKSAIYEKAIKDTYGIKIKVPKDMTNTNFDKMFDMLGTIPKDDVKQKKFKKLIYSDAADDKGSGAYYPGAGKIEMGDFGDATGSEDYEIDGEVIPANSFSVTALHEVGHAVDDRHNIMGKNGKKAGCGGWEKESLKSATAAFLPELKKVVPAGSTVADKELSKVIHTALDKGTTAQPDDIADDDWAPIVGYLTGNCLPVRSDSSPWFAASQVVIGGRVYQEAYGGEWWSYAFSARAATKVNGYQWRSPAEWFAEVYAISWLAKKKPPAGVDASVAEHMYRA